MAQDKPLTSEEYVAKKGLVCPHCQGEHIDGKQLSVEGGQAFQDVSCNDCDAEWTDIYDLKGWM